MTPTDWAHEEGFSSLASAEQANWQAPAARKSITFDIERATAQLWTILIDGKPRYNGERFKPAQIRERVRVLRQSCEVALSDEAAALIEKIDANESKAEARREKRAKGKQR